MSGRKLTSPARARSSELDAEYYAMRPRCRCGAPLDYATDDNMCVACVREIASGNPEAFRTRLAERKRVPRARRAAGG